jgi:hypothetical protein
MTLDQTQGMGRNQQDKETMLLKGNETQSKMRQSMRRR